MVQLMSSAKKSAVKLELHDSLEDQLGPLKKRSKLKEEYDSETTSFPIPPSMYNPLEEPSPLGLRLKKTPSFLDLIEMKLSQENASKLAKFSKKRGNAVSGSADKLKASNFPGSLLKIGSWEYKSRYEGDLVAKCYFAKHKLVWEVLDGGLKNKIEVQWSDIVAIKATYTDDEPGTLDVVLARQPLFFRETNPQPRKHTLWQATSDFTGGQASIHRHHFLMCPQGMLGKHFEKLMQCDPRLNFLSQEPEILLESPYFESKVPIYDESDVSSHSKREEGPVSFDLQHAASPSGVQSSSSNFEQDFFNPSTSSVPDTCGIGEISSSRAKEPNMLSHWDQIKIPGFHPSMSMSDLVNHIGNCISERRTSGTSMISDDDLQAKEILDEITQYLLSDAQFTGASDEKSLMSRVNSLCCLLQDSTAAQNTQVKGNEGININIHGDGNIRETNSSSVSACETKVGKGFCGSDGDPTDISGCKPAPGMSRKDSIAELLHNLPRIASLPQFLFNLSASNEER